MVSGCYGQKHCHPPARPPTHLLNGLELRGLRQPIVHQQLPAVGQKQRMEFQRSTERATAQCRQHGGWLPSPNSHAAAVQHAAVQRAGTRHAMRTVGCVRHTAPPAAKLPLPPLPPGGSLPFFPHLTCSTGSRCCRMLLISSRVLWEDRETKGSRVAVCGHRAGSRHLADPAAPAAACRPSHSHPPRQHRAHTPRARSSTNNLMDMFQQTSRNTLRTPPLTGKWTRGRTWSGRGSGTCPSPARWGLCQLDKQHSK